MRRLQLLPVFLGLVGAACGTPQRPAMEPAWLLTPEEAAALDQAPADPALNLGARGGEDTVITLIRTDGPDLEFVQPSAETRSLRSPIDIVIRFRPKTTPPDLASLSIRLCKETFVGCLGNRDLMPRLKAFTTADGISATGLPVPKGNYKVRFELADEAGGRTVGDLRVKVAS